MPKTRAPQEPTLYTYRCGEKVPLSKRPDQFVARAAPEALPAELGSAEQVSSVAYRYSCPPERLDEMMAATREVATAHHAYDLAETGQEFLITDRILVSFKNPPSVDDLGAFTGKYALRVLERYSLTDFLMRLTDDTGMNPVKLVVLLAEGEPTLESIDHDLNVVIKKRALTLPTDAAYRREWHLHRSLPAAPDYDRRSSANCEAAWQLLNGFGSAEVVVGVTDDGCQLDHPDFDGSDKFAGWGYFQGNTLFRRGDPGANPALMYQNGADHGTACAGVIAAEVDGLMTVGAAPGCRLAPIKWESSGPSLFISDSKLMTAFNYLADKADIVSNSWGSSPSQRFSQAVVNRLTQLTQNGGRRGKGILFLWAAGNENCPISLSTNVNVPFSHGWNGNRWVGVETSRVFSNNLVGIPGIGHVAALASTAQRSHYSNWGPGIDFCAPSSNSHAYWRLELPGRGITATEGRSRVTDDFGGTSSATPLVAGIAALVLSAKPDLTAVELQSLLRQTASKDLNLTPWPKTPPASFDPNPSWDVSPIAPFNSGAFQNTGSVDGTWSPWFGHGKVDAEVAVARALGSSQTSGTRISVANETVVDIPDNKPFGAQSRVTVDQAGNVRSVKVTVDIEHTYIGDLAVRLIGPDGRAASLHRRSGGDRDDLKVSYDQASAPELAGFVGRAARGTWILEVVDKAAIDSGKIKRWQLDLELEGS